jgi:hypothetical protein
VSHIGRSNQINIGNYTNLTEFIPQNTTGRATLQDDDDDNNNNGIVHY